MYEINLKSNRQVDSNLTQNPVFQEAEETQLVWDCLKHGSRIFLTWPSVRADMCIASWVSFRIWYFGKKFHVYKKSLLLLSPVWSPMKLLGLWSGSGGTTGGKLANHRELGFVYLFAFFLRLCTAFLLERKTKQKDAFLLKWHLQMWYVAFVLFFYLTRTVLNCLDIKS